MRLMADKTLKRILETSANLPAFYLFIITSLHLTNKTDNNLIDEFTSIVALLLTSLVFSFISIIAEIKAREYRLNKLQHIYSFFRKSG